MNKILLLSKAFLYYKQNLKLYECNICKSLTVVLGENSFKSILYILDSSKVVTKYKSTEINIIKHKYSIVKVKTPV